MKKATKTNNKCKTLCLLPDNGLLGVLADIAVVSTLITASISLLLLCVTLAGKITIIVGK